MNKDNLEPLPEMTMEEAIHETLPSALNALEEAMRLNVKMLEKVQESINKIIFFQEQMFGKK